MNVSEKRLYHQIHPLKLTTDISAGIISLYSFWHHALLWGIGIHFFPPLIASFLLMKYSSGEKQKQSKLGRYMKANMTVTAIAIRITGDLISIFAAWYQSLLLIILGLGVILLGWTIGLLRK